MAFLSGMYCCECGVNTDCEWEDLNIGRVFECPSCHVVCGHVVPKAGGRAWVRIEPAQVKFYRLLDEPEEE
jgi:hypothetical protein